MSPWSYSPSSSSVPASASCVVDVVCLLWLVLSVLLLSARGGGALTVRNSTTFNSLQWAGRGYDMVMGNPLATFGGDPGYRLPCTTCRLPAPPPL